MLGVGLLVLGFLAVMLGILADLVSANRKLLEQISTRISKLEDEKSESD